ncbi:cysteine desulfurase-like protein [Nocardioides rubriscoriae]|uniref:cysteine desulfurase-like protein n=1 Tax=Nocardioides rubriscoriae TaxID=642762 RepID=UPI0011DF5FA6|nr:cysteine desulfurase-like protein [Nocardioides rubriscoriae]
MSTFDVERVRASFPALDSGLVRFDGPGGSLLPVEVAQAVATAMTSGMCQRGSLTEPERLTEATTQGARAAIGRLLDADPAGVVFGRSMTAIAFDVARALAATWGPGDEVVVTRLDHDANVRPWVLAAEAAGATVRWLGFDPVTTELDDPATVLSERTRLVALTGASNLFGTRPPVRAVADAAHAVGALVHVDAVHLAAHAPVSLGDLGADLLTCSPYKFFGPHLGALAAAPALLETLRPGKLLPSSDAVPERFELGTLPYEQLAGVTAAVDFIDAIGGMPLVEEHEAALLDRLLTGLAGLDHVRVHGTPARRTPTVLLHVDGRAGDDVRADLAAQGVLAPAGSFYAIEASRHAGLGDTGGVRVGLSPYSTDVEVDRLLEALAAL